MKRMHSTPEGKALYALGQIKRKASKLGRPPGSTEGFTRAKRNKIINVAKAEAIEIVSYMEQKGYEIPKQEFAKEAITTAVEIMRRDDILAKDKLAAAKAVLEWTMAKPATETNVNVKTAESFLEDIAAEMKASKE